MSRDKNSIFHAAGIKAKLTKTALKELAVRRNFFSNSRVLWSILTPVFVGLF
jgi:hypothetical protein